MKRVSKRLVVTLIAMLLLCAALMTACAKDEAKKPAETDGDDATTTVATTTAPTTTGTTQKGYADGGVSVRDEPGLGGENIDTLYEQEITIVDKHGDWYEIEYTDPYGEHKHGYVNGQVIQIDGKPNASQMVENLPTTTTTVATDENGETVTTTTEYERVEGIPGDVIEDDPNW
ncbi:MAG: SH3 domain-containing protein [Clostridia bacterium]|nr:SH3 domain-containing protein [Clostridia bacterium]